MMDLPPLDGLPRQEPQPTDAELDGVRTWAPRAEDPDGLPTYSTTAASVIVAVLAAGPLSVVDR